MYKISTFTYPFISRGKYFVVNTNIKKLFEIDKKHYHLLIDNNIEDLIKSEYFKLFIESKLLIKEDYDELELFYQMNKDNDEGKYWRTLHIIPTTRCNLACKYCFVLKDKENNIEADLNNEFLYNAIDYFFEDNQCEKPLVTFYGGEPLIRPSILYDTISYINNTLNKDIEKKIITNATLITNEIASFLKKEEFDVAVSLDGDKFSNDINRVNKNNESSYEDVINGIKLLKKHGNSIKILMTVGDHNVNRLESCLEEIMKYNPTSIALNLPKKLQKSNNEIEENLNFEKLMDIYFKCLDKCYEKQIPEMHYADIVFGFLRDEIQYKPCHGCGQQLVVSPYGKIGPCQAYISTGKYFIDFDRTIKKDQLIRTEVFNKWNNINMLEVDKCRKCYLLPVCPGDCPYDHENRSGNLNNPPDSFCYTRKRIFDYLLDKLSHSEEILFKN